ncbi:MAG: Gfo/Idh/MocA family oxidoreductase, partial [Longimicrobiales bacterium]
MTPPLPPSFSRRLFVQTTAAASMGLVLPRGAYADGREAALRVGVIGCGGRGTGAATDCMRASENVEIVALGDVAPDRLAEAVVNLTKFVADNPTLAPKYRVTPDRTFTGFDVYEKVLASDVDLVILATPPGFRPLHLSAAVDAGKHIFTEKPVATDVAGALSVIATYERSLAKGLHIVAGTQRRHNPGYVEVVQRMRDGAIGDVLNGQVYWNQGGLWSKPREASWSDMEWQMRNWLYFTWLSGDHIVEQHVHNMDVANWVMDGHPIRATGLGGRQWRTGPEFGN